VPDKRLLLVTPFIFYLSLPTRNYYWDGVAFAINIEKRGPLSSLFHPNHLLYTVWGALLTRAADLIGIHARALYVMQAANILLAAVSVLLVYKIFRLYQASRGESTIGALVFAFSAEWWRFATDADAYIPSIFLLLCAYYALESSENEIAAGLAVAGAMLFHELAILFLPVGLFRLKGRRKSARFLAASLLPVATAYIMAYHSIAGSFSAGGFFAWITSRAADSGFSFQIGKDVWWTALGTLRLFFGGRIHDAIHRPVSIVVLVVLAALAIGFIVLRWREVSVPVRPLAKPAIVWLSVYVAFLCFWMPQNTFYRLFCLVPLILLFGSAVRSLALCFLLLWNLTFLIYPQSQAVNNVPLRFALMEQRNWPAGTPIVFHRFHSDLWTISYFNPQATWIGLDSVDIAQLDRDLAYAHQQNKPLWVEQTAYEMLSADPQGLKWLHAHEASGRTLLYEDAKHEFSFHRCT
jgi:hypothetical protein